MSSIRRGAALLEPVIALGVAAFVAVPWLEADRDPWWLPGTVVIGALALAGVAGLVGLRRSIVVLLRGGLAVGVLVLASTLLPDPDWVLAACFAVVALVYPLVLPVRLAIPTVFFAAAGLANLVITSGLLDPLMAAAGAGLVVAIGLAATLAARSAEDPIPDPPVVRSTDPSLGVAFDTAAGGLVLLDADARIVRANRAFGDLVGRSPDGLVGASWWGQIGPDEVDEQQARFAQLLRGEVWNFHVECRLRTRDRRLIWVVIGMSMVAGAAGEPHRVFVQVTNIDERAHRELTLRERVAGSRRSFECAPAPMWEIGLDELEPALERWRRDRIDDLASHLDRNADVLRHTVATLDIRDVNDAAKQLVGAEDREEFVRGLRGGRLGPGFEHALAAQLGALWRGHRVDARQADLQDFEGTTHPGLLQMAVTDGEGDSGGAAMLVAFTELSDLLGRREALDSVESRLHSLLAAAPVVLFATDASGLFTLFEGRALADMELAPGEVVGRSVFEVYRDRSEIVTAMRTALDGGALTATAVMNGRSFETRYMPVFERGRVTGVIGLAVDVTDRPPAGGSVRADAGARHTDRSIAGNPALSGEWAPDDLEPRGVGEPAPLLEAGDPSPPEPAVPSDAPWEAGLPVASFEMEEPLPALGRDDAAEGTPDDVDGAAGGEEIEPGDLSDLEALLAEISGDVDEEGTGDLDVALEIEPIVERFDWDLMSAGSQEPSGRTESEDPQSHESDDPAGDIPGWSFPGLTVDDADDAIAGPPSVEIAAPAPGAIDLWEQVDLALEARRPAKPIATNRDGSMAKVFGTGATLQRALGALLDNADRHGGPRLTVRVDRLGSEYALSVIDDGPGLPAAVRSCVFGAVPDLASGTLGELRRDLLDIGGDLTYDYRQGHSVFAVTLPAV